MISCFAWKKSSAVAPTGDATIHLRRPLSNMQAILNVIWSASSEWKGQAADLTICRAYSSSNFMGSMDDDMV